MSFHQKFKMTTNKKDLKPPTLSRGKEKNFFSIASRRLTVWGTIQNPKSKIQNRMSRKQVSFQVLTALAVVSAVSLSAIALPGSAFATPRTEISTITSKANSQSWQNPQLIRNIRAHSQAVSAIAITNNGQTIVSGSDDGTIKVWNLRTGTLMRTLRGHSDSIVSLAISPNGQTLATASGLNDQSVKLWDLRTGRLIRTIKQPDWFVKSVAFSPDSKTLALGIWNTAASKPEVEVLNIKTGKSIYSFQGSSQSNLTVAFSPDGKTLASGNEDSTIQLWDLGTGKLIRTLNHGAAVRAIDFSKDGKTLFSESYTQTVKSWNLQTGELISTPIADSGIVFVNAVAFHPNDQIVASALGGENAPLNLLDLKTGNAIGQLTESGTVSSLAFSPNGKTLVSGNFNGTISIWQAR
jgi:WD40 repeat protein